MATKKRELIVCEMETDKVVRRIDVSGKSERTVERTEMGLLRNMDLENFYVTDSNDIRLDTAEGLGKANGKP